jgi:hypothetical protein
LSIPQLRHTMSEAFPPRIVRNDNYRFLFFDGQPIQDFKYLPARLRVE